MDTAKRSIRDRKIMRDIRAGIDHRKVASQYDLTYARILQIK